MTPFKFLRYRVDGALKDGWSAVEVKLHTSVTKKFTYPLKALGTLETFCPHLSRNKRRRDPR